MLRDEKNIRMPGGLYHELQVRMTYNSNHIEGAPLDTDGGAVFPRPANTPAKVSSTHINT